MSSLVAGGAPAVRWPPLEWLRNPRTRAAFGVSTPGLRTASNREASCPTRSRISTMKPISILSFPVLCVLATGSQPARSTSPESDDRQPAPTVQRAQPKIAFSSKRDGNWEIYVMDADGRQQTRLTTSPSQDRFPVWSPNGRQIVFGSERAGQWELWVMESDGSRLMLLTTGIVAKGPRSWSPDGAQIVFESDRDANREIYSIRADGTRLARLTHNPAEDYSPRWSPDGTKIAFVSSRATAIVRSI